MTTTTATTTRSIPAKRALPSDPERDDWCSNMRPPTSTKRTATGVPRCDCNLQATLNSISKAGATQGRIFWTCARESARLRCKFFEWSDDSTNEGGSGNSGNRHEGSVRLEGRMNGVGPGGNGSGAGACYRCGQSGHWSSDCTGPVQPSSNSTTKGSTGTKRGAQNTRGKGRGRGGSRSSGGKDDGCFRCGKKGHWSSECPGA